MADKTINELTAATTMGNDDLLVLQQGGTAKKLSGKQLGDYVYNAAAEKVAEVNQAVDNARSSINDIVESVQSMTELGTDTTLTTSGMAADSKAAGDKIKEVEAAATAVLSQGAAIESMIAGRETAMETTKNYTSGSLVIVNNTLYKLDANVASGESLIPEINCHITTVAAVITSRVPSSRTVNGKALSSDIVLTAEDISYDDSLSTHANGSVGEAVSGLKKSVSNIGDKYVALEGENQVTPQNIEGMRFTKTPVETQGENIFSETYLGENGYYVSVDTETTPPIIAHAMANSYRWYAIPVDGVSKYRFTEARFACLGKDNRIGSEAVGLTNSYASEIITTGASYLFLSYGSSVQNIEVHKVNIEYEYSDFVLPDWMRENSKPKYISANGNLTDNTFLALLGYKQNLRKGERYIFEGNINTFSSIAFGFTVANNFAISNIVYNEFIIDNTNITYKTRSSDANYTYQYAHGLTIENNIQFIFEYLSDAKAHITLISNGVSFKQEVPFVKQTISQVVAISLGSDLANCKLTWVPIDIEKSIWLFGDSYVTYNAGRWAYYLNSYNYINNILLDGFPGEGSVNARNSLMTLIKFGTPKFVVWCMGMNDPDTDANTPNSDWLTRINEMLTICTNNNIIPILATIPNVPNIINAGKDKWVKESGYRYIDFAKAVGAENAGSSWYTGMLSGDNIHPSENGAKALFAQVLLDFPEIMLN